MFPRTNKQKYHPGIPAVPSLGSGDHEVTFKKLYVDPMQKGKQFNYKIGEMKSIIKNVIEVRRWSSG